MKREEFLDFREKLHSFVRKTILTEKENIFGEKVGYSFSKALTSKDKKELKQVYEDNMFVKNVNIDDTSIIVEFKNWVDARELGDYIKNMREFSETLLPSSYVFDDEESVRWNREQVAKENIAIKERKALDMKARQILRDSMKKSIIFGTIDFFGLKNTDYDSVEVAYEYLKGANASDEEVAKNIYALMDTILKYNEMAKKGKKK